MNIYIVLILICCLLFQLTGCYTPQLVSKEELISTPEHPGLVIKTNEQVEYAFKKGAYVIANDSIYGAGSLILENGAEVERNVFRQISLEELESIKLEKIDGIKTALLIAASVGLGVLLILGVQSLMDDATENIASGIGKGLQGIFK